MTKILAASIVRNAIRFLRPMIESLSWVDAHLIVDDHSTDGTSELLRKLCTETPRLIVINPWFSGPMIPVVEGRRDLSREQGIRNRFVDIVYERHQPNAVVLVDADELMHRSLRHFIELTLAGGGCDAIALECNHLVNKAQRLRIFEQSWNGVSMIDPHVRILIEKRSYQPGAWAEVPDCFIKPTERTRCLSGPYHFHLRYLEWLGEQNLALPQLGSQPTLLSVSPLADFLPTSLPSEIKQLIDVHFPA